MGGELGRCGWECGVGGRSALLSNVSCHFSLCLQSETASRKQGGCNRIKTVPQSGGLASMGGRRGDMEGGREQEGKKGWRRENGQREEQVWKHQESAGNN